VTSRREEFSSFSDRRLDAAEARAYLDAPVTDAERDEVLALVHWFNRRYPAPLDRLAYVRRAYARWQRTLGIAGPTVTEKRAQ
jgi:hypothetical protein